VWRESVGEECDKGGRVSVFQWLRMEEDEWKFLESVATNGERGVRRGGGVESVQG